VKTVFNRAALFAYRAAAVYRAMADVKWARGDGPMPGNVVTFTKISALTVATSALSETADPSAVALADTQVSITLLEQGNLTLNSRKLQLTSFTDIDLAAVREITANMEESMDIIARTPLDSGTNVNRPGGKARASLLATDNMTANLVRTVVQKLRGKNAPTPDGGPYYPAVTHPDAAFDLMTETGAAAWTAPHIYSDPAGIYAGEIGAFAGARFIQNANANLRVDAGSGGTVDVYDTLFFGQQALGEAVGDAQHVHIGRPNDAMERFVPVSWYALAGYGIIRQDSLWRIEAASSIGAN
jgi:N4-gp56 family major capsid protein